MVQLYSHGKYKLLSAEKYTADMSELAILVGIKEDKMVTAEVTLTRSKI